MTAIRVEHVWMEYGDQIVLENISLDFAPRSFVALVGPSGCGKTTFLRLLLSEERPTRGRITVDGAPLAPEPGADRGVVFQRYSVFPHLTVLGNVLLAAELPKARLSGRLFGAARRRAEEEARALIAEVGLAGAEDKYPAALSGGMQQRLALAQALMRKPRILLLDEPFGALDPGIRADIHGLMLALWHNCEMSVVMVTHDLREAFTLATRVIAFERRRSGDDRARFGAVVARDIEVWPRRIAGRGHPTVSGRDDPASPMDIGRDDPAPLAV
ncbi:ABC transporter ATP-binding protein [Aquabacter spiritensis]|uniref:NitT/TauT family transport system ATP-binding protein n=1 Tax=Aquabacter spiritensis TaxID=933073 RepID=A0A4R3M1I6_9HYPH|nr:ATP-binding cassette domain-containing protein [Aquabacter spiritensis]TCT06039.1 NitT/TauT family transport system ATP-binding protein [Aquabacter spiritensis]